MPQDLPKALVLDEIRLRQILLNLVGNAVKFTNTGTVTLRVEHQEDPTDSAFIQLNISVIDTGIGIPKDQQRVIFESFTQQSGQDSKAYGGTGLGLAITRRLVEMMDGIISVESIPGKGSHFMVSLPRVKICQRKPLSIEPKPQITEHVLFNHEKVLIVDDVESNRSLLKEFLLQMDLDPLEAQNGQEAILVATECRPDFIIMDIRMPVMDGINATRTLREMESFQNTPILALTASLDKRSLEDIHQNGFSGYTSKPIEVPQLVSEITRFISPKSRKTILNQPIHDDRNSIGKITDPNILSSLKEKFLPEISTLSGGLKIQGVQSLGKELINFGKKYHIVYFEQSGLELLKQTNKFDIPAINKTLQNIRETVKQLTMGEYDEK